MGRVPRRCWRPIWRRWGVGAALLALLAWRVARSTGPPPIASSQRAQFPASHNDVTAVSSARPPNPSNAPGSARAPSQLTPGVYQVVRVVDGDTLVLQGVKRRVRLQGVDAPEIAAPQPGPRKKGAQLPAAYAQTARPWGPYAAEFVRTFVRRAGGSLRLEIDGETTDHYGRYLAFAWHEKELLNEALVRAGLARALLDFPYGEHHKSRLAAAEREARSHARGIWSR